MQTCFGAGGGNWTLWHAILMILSGKFQTVITFDPGRVTGPVTPIRKALDEIYVTQLPMAVGLRFRGQKRPFKPFLELFSVVMPKIVDFLMPKLDYCKAVQPSFVFK